MASGNGDTSPQVIGVIDLAGGSALHARGGRREHYRPVTEVAGVQIEPGDAIELARAYVNRGVRELYAADLDAIAGRPPQTALVTDIARCGVPLWLDAGLRTVDDARRAAALGAAHVVVGLETLPSFDTLAAIVAASAGTSIAFSLDLRDGVPVTSQRSAIDKGESPESLATRAAAAGADAIIVLDLARVGSGRGVDLELLSLVRNAAPGCALVAGGGVRDAHDLAMLAGAGCDAALVATALLDGRLTPADIAPAWGAP